MGFFFFNDTATTEIYTLSLHDALPIWTSGRAIDLIVLHTMEADECDEAALRCARWFQDPLSRRSEEHTSELQSRQYLVCRLLLEKKKKIFSATQTSVMSRLSLLLCNVS